MKSVIRQAFEAVRDGYAADRVVADPTLNQHFVSECRRRGLEFPVCTLNRALLNLRKGGRLAGSTRSRKTSFYDEEDYQFASEIAVRFLERRDRITLDDIICDPEIAGEFDRVAAQISPGFTSLQYRWAALNLRKRRALRPEIIAHALPSKSVTVTRVDILAVGDVPVEQGIYIFYEPSQTLYVGEATNLRNRIKKHLDHSDNKGLARWLWEHEMTEVFLELHVLESSVATRVRRALEAELIMTRQPVFNIQNT
jgi:site-specific DNA-methyltransferase (adenine-specific)